MKTTIRLVVVLALFVLALGVSSATAQTDSRFRYTVGPDGHWYAPWPVTLSNDPVTVFVPGRDAVVLDTLGRTVVLAEWHPSMGAGLVQWGAPMAFVVDGRIPWFEVLE